MPDHRHAAKIDEHKSGNGNENFLNAFLGNVQTSSDSSVMPLTNVIEDAKSFSSDQDDKHIKDKDDIDHNGYDYDDDYDSHSHRDDYEEEDRYYKAKLNCREFHYPHATTPVKCNAVRLRDYEPDYNRDDVNEKAFCRWDMGFADDKHKQAGCLCPRTKYKCHKDDQCFWYKPKSYDSKHGDDKNQGQCVHNSERFYNILANLLSKRGKKDFALKIKYSSAAAKAELPYGPWGPAFIGHQEEPYSHNPHLASPYDYYSSYQRPNTFGYGNPMQYGDSYDGYGLKQHGLNSYGYGDYYGTMGGPGSYGHHGYEGYGNNGYQDYHNTGGYDNHFSVPNYQQVASDPNIQHGFTNYDMPYGSPGYAHQPQPTYQNNGYSPNLSIPSHQGSAAPVVANGHYEYLPNREANDLLSGQAIKPLGAPEYLTTNPLINDQPSYEHRILYPQGHSDGQHHSAVDLALNNFALGGAGYQQAGNQPSLNPVLPASGYDLQSPYSVPSVPNNSQLDDSAFIQRPILQGQTNLNYGNVPFNQQYFPNYPSV